MNVDISQHTIHTPHTSHPPAPPPAPPWPHIFIFTGIDKLNAWILWKWSINFGDYIYRHFWQWLKIKNDFNWKIHLQKSIKP